MKERVKFYKNIFPFIIVVSTRYCTVQQSDISKPVVSLAPADSAPRRLSGPPRTSS